MTRERLRIIEALLLAKIRTGSQVSPLERQVRFLAKQAYRLMSIAPAVPSDELLPFVRGFSQHAAFGSIGPTMPKFAGNGEWIYQTIHNGNPDPDRKLVHARSTDLMLKLWESGSARINASDGPISAELDKLRAYILGHACHIAADTVSSPFLHAMVWDLVGAGETPRTQEQASAAIEIAVNHAMRVSGTATGTIANAGWMPGQADLPRGFFDSFQEAFEQTYGLGPQVRPLVLPTDVLKPQTTKAWFRSFTSGGAPLSADQLRGGFGSSGTSAVSSNLLRDSFRSFSGAQEQATFWGWGDWVLATMVIFLPPILAYPFILTMDHTRALFKTGATVNGAPPDTAIGALGLVMAPLATSLAAPVALSLYIAFGSSMGVGAETIFGWIAGGVNLITSLIFLGVRNDTGAPAASWIFLFVIPYALLLAHSLFVLIRGNGPRQRRIQLALASLVPLIITAVYLLFHLAWHQSQDLGMNAWLSDGWGSAGFIGGWVLWAVLLIAAWFLLALALKDGPAPQAAVPVAPLDPARQPRFVRLFEHGTLFFDGQLTLTPSDEFRNPKLSSHYYPTDRRPLLKLWWEGSGDLFFRCDRNLLRFSSSQDGTADLKVVLAPTASLTAADFAYFLEQTIAGLRATLALPDEFDPLLAPGDVFADAADQAGTLADVRNASQSFTRLPTVASADANLFQASRRNLSSRMGKEDLVFTDRSRLSVATGDGTCAFSGAAVTGTGTHFATFLRPGDVIVSTTGNQSRIVIDVADDLHLTVNLAFGAEVGTAAQNYTRAAANSESDLPLGNIQATNRFRIYSGSGFEAALLPGDTLRVDGEERRVVQVLSATEVAVDRPFAAPGACVRVGRISREGFRYVPDSIPGSIGGESLLERAADLGAILAMSTASQLLTNSERAAVTSGPAEDQRAAINPVNQVFRNWNLSQRRVNEWRMLIGGSAVSEKGDRPADPDAMQRSGWVSPAAAGEPVSNQMGWIPLFERWLDGARRPDVDIASATSVLRAGDPSNRKLSEAIAYLFDLPAPA
jgi:hypothetical protein